MANFVKSIIVDGTKAPYNSTLEAITPAGDTYKLPHPPPGSTVENDLPKLLSDAQFRVRIIADGGAQSTSPEMLTRSDSSDKSACFTASGSAANPVFTFVNIKG